MDSVSLARGRTRRRQIIATILLAASGLAFAILIALELAGCNFLYNPGQPPAAAYGLIMVPLLALSFSTLGFLIVAFRPENRIGWLCLLGGSIVLLGFTAGSYGFCGLEGQLTLPAVPFMLWLASLLTQVGIVFFFVLLPLWFPDGRFLSTNWRRFGRLAAVLLGIAVLLDTFWPGTLFFTEGLTQLEVINPYALSVDPPRWLNQFIDALLSFGLSAATITAFISLWLRWRRSTGETRQQLKWFAYFLATAGLMFMGVEIIGDLFYPAIFDGWFYLIELAAFWLGYPLVIGLAIFKYRLYDIDLLIRRTLVYAVLTGTLAVVYFGVVTALQSAVTAVSGHRSPVAIVISTLIIAALFTPLRRRIQDLIDRRFFRQKYDAAQTLADFARAARDEVNLDQLTARLLAVVDETMRPVHLTLWLNDADRREER